MTKPTLLAALAALALAAPLARADHLGKVPWVTEPEQGFEAARSQRRPILMFFSASW